MDIRKILTIVYAVLFTCLVLCFGIFFLEVLHHIFLRNRFGNVHRDAKISLGTNWFSMHAFTFGFIFIGIAIAACAVNLIFEQKGKTSDFKIISTFVCKAIVLASFIFLVLAFAELQGVVVTPSSWSIADTDEASARLVAIAATSILALAIINTYNLFYNLRKRERKVGTKNYANWDKPHFLKNLCKAGFF